MLNLETGKYAFYVWTAYGLSASVFVAMIWSSLSLSRRWKARCEQLTRK